MLNASLLTLEAVAARLGVGRTTVQRLISSGALPAIRQTGHWRKVYVRADDLERYIARTQSPILAELAAVRVDIEKLRATLPGPLETLDEVRQHLDAALPPLPDDIDNADATALRAIENDPIASFVEGKIQQWLATRAELRSRFRALAGS